MAVYVSNIVIEQGFDFDVTFGLADIRTNGPVNLVGYASSAQIRKNFTSSNSVSFASTIIGSNSGLVNIKLTSQQTSQLKPGRYFYDVVLTNPDRNDKYKAVEGMALVRPGVTR